MSSGRVGNFTRSEWAAMEADARTHQQLLKNYGSLKAAKAAGAYDPNNTRSGYGLSVATNTVRNYNSNSNKFNVSVKKNGNFSLDKNQSRATGQKLVTTNDKSRNSKSLNYGSSNSKQMSKRASTNPSARNNIKGTWGKTKTATSSKTPQSTKSTKSATSNRNPGNKTPKPKLTGASRRDSTNRYYSSKTGKYYPTRNAAKRAGGMKSNSKTRKTKSIKRRK